MALSYLYKYTKECVNARNLSKHDNEATNRFQNYSYFWQQSVTQTTTATIPDQEKSIGNSDRRIKLETKTCWHANWSTGQCTTSNRTNFWRYAEILSICWKKYCICLKNNALWTWSLQWFSSIFISFRLCLAVVPNNFDFF